MSRVYWRSFFSIPNFLYNLVYCCHDYNYHWELLLEETGIASLFACLNGDVATQESGVTLEVNSWSVMAHWLLLHREVTLSSRRGPEVQF